MDTALYVSGEYLAKHPSWHVEDSSWKATHVLNMVARHKLEPTSVVEIGCGAGEILAQLQPRLRPDCHLTGYEISPQAFAMCHSRANHSLTFSDADAFAPTEPRADLALAMDVLEHVEDYPAFLRSMRARARFSIFHIPLDLSLLSLVTGLPVRVRRSAGHLHYFTRSLALAAIQEAGFDIIDDIYTRPAIERPNRSLRGSLARLPRLALATLDTGTAATLLGGFSLLVLAESKEIACS